MPFMHCQVKGKRGWKYGRSGKCYAGKSGKKRAQRQARAMHAAGYKSKHR